MELIGSKAVSPIRTSAEACIQAEEYWKVIIPSHLNLRTHSVAEPNLPRTEEPILTPKSAVLCTINGSECDLPGLMSRDDDEDSSPLVQDLDLAEHIPCSTHDTTTSGHGSNTLTHSGILLATFVSQSHSSGSTKSCQAETKNFNFINAQRSSSSAHYANHAL